MAPLCDSLLSAFMRKKSRMFAIAEALRARRTGVTAAELAQRFNVTLRTIYRDLEALQDAGMPIRAETIASPSHTRPSARTIANHTTTITDSGPR